MKCIKVGVAVFKTTKNKNTSKQLFGGVLRKSTFDRHTEAYTRIWVRLTGIHLFLSTFSNIIKKETPAQIFFWEFCKIFQNCLLVRHLSTTACKYENKSTKKNRKFFEICYKFPESFSNQFPFEKIYNHSNILDILYAIKAGQKTSQQ